MFDLGSAVLGNIWIVLVRMEAHIHLSHMSIVSYSFPLLSAKKYTTIFTCNNRAVF